MAMPNSSPDIMPQAEALRALGLTGAADAEAIRAAFRARVRHADPARHGGCDARLRRLIQARDLLIQPVKTLQPTHDKKSLYASATELRLNLAEAIYGGEIACEVVVECVVGDVGQNLVGRGALVGNVRGHSGSCLSIARRAARKEGLPGQCSWPRGE